MSRTKSLYWFSLILLGFFIYSCKVQENETEKVKIRLKPHPTKFLVQQLLDKEFKFNTLSTKAAFTYNNGKTTSFKAHLRIRKDSAIWVSITPVLGIEMARVLITQDTVKIMNRSSSEYFVGDYDYLNTIFGADLDYQMIEALLIGNSLDFEINDKIYSSVDRKKDLYFVSTEKKRKVRREIKKDKGKIKNQAQALWLDPVSYKINELLLTTPQSDNSLNCLYTNFKNPIYSSNSKDSIASQIVSHDLHFILKTDTSSTIDINYTKITLNNLLTFPFNIPKKYAQIKQ